MISFMNNGWFYERTSAGIYEIEKSADGEWNRTREIAGRLDDLD